jgi:CHAT domain-containing protein
MPALRAPDVWRSAPAILVLAGIAIACHRGGRPAAGTARQAGGRARPEQAAPTVPAAPGAAKPSVIRRTFVLSAGPGVERTLAGGETDVYGIDLTAGQYLGAVVDQLGIDVYVDAVDPEGHLLFHADRTNGAHGPEAVDLVADHGGRYRLEVGAAAGTAPGRYRAHIAAPRPAGDRDHLLYRAERAFFVARAIHKRQPEAGFWQAAAQYEQAARMFRDLGDTRGEADALFFVGRLYQEQGRPAGGLAALERAGRLYSALEDPIYLANSLNSLGQCESDLDDLAGAREHFRKALILWKRLHDRAGEAASLLNQGAADQLAGRRWDALGEFHSALDLWQQLGGHFQDRVSTLAGLAWVYSSVGDWEPALAAGRQMLAVARSARDAELERRAMTQLGGICSVSGRRVGIVFLRRALQLAASTGSPSAAAWNGLGVGLSRLGNYAEARDAYKQAIRLYLKADRPRDLATAWINLGQADAVVQHSDEALGDFQQAFVLGKEHRDPLATLRSLAGMAQVEEQRGRYAVAQDRAEKAIDQFEALRTAAARSDLRISYLAADESIYDLLIRVLMLRHRQLPEGGYDLMALARSEQSRARDLLDQLAIGRLPGADPVLVAQRRHLVAELARLDAAAHSFGASANQALAAAAAADDVLDRLSDVDARLHAAASGVPAARPADAQEIDRLRKRLDRSTVVLEYHLSAPASFVWAISADAILSFELPGRDRLEPLIRATREALLGATPGRTAAASGSDPALALSRELLGPVAAALGDKCLLIAADGALQYIPFAALPDPAGGGPLLLRHEIATIPSLQVMAALRERPVEIRGAGHRVAVLADPVFDATDRRVTRRAPDTAPRAAAQPDAADSFLPRLASSRTEADAIAALAGPGAAFEAVDFDASPGIVTSGELAPYSILHFATHGILRTDRPELSSLVLSRVHADGSPADGYLRASDIEGLDLPAELVVLSACDTAGSDIAGEGLVGLPQAFFIAGARRVVVTLWAIDDGSSAALMQEFYRRLLGRPRSASEPAPAPLSPAAALREAQRAIRQIPRWSSPRHWAGFVLTGAWP